ncbi:hypothetical protein ECHHL_0587 [Ehrlichia chaffeensis str. Heartland]|uniref:Uncharacterized protein n=1 Tax=Ehrlichia chaffeensis (strain ATCC CRL-10679 / Arkansas) TaxID=205920 RepID=Q2GGG2_EHRCR|nr:hypothetical protein [Ehrlichia chaffeensis]ABD44681.1 conserved hypothetical protein [Ehrlichia chaffeensis str. Arkansas]AHX03742.1 hypothetical protein ECHHL_0587 [Ehrlichia chaffeensis str. Heartland]AHX05537.1 hypothetical protein ECHJAX_0470 [Ehrlichia chaffeensis str. Jax]AHX06527.1 hypothetical protein ECHLIB_0471 [Ehrlichia chaffeensis str. Liberty]AHX07494.1 hypothetical protein ECHOSC_0596 [Ehrlichia chaffeensis str. Osceola]
MLQQQKLIYKIIDRCNNYQKLCRIEKEISALLKITQDKSLLNSFSTIKQVSSKEYLKKEGKQEEIQEENAELENNISYRINISDNNENNEEIENIKNLIKLKLNILMSVIAHEMDPVRRAGETAASNRKDAKKFGRSTKDSSSLAIVLLKMILNQVKLILEVATTNSKDENQKIENQKDMDTEQKLHLPNLIQKENQQGRNR